MKHQQAGDRCQSRHQSHRCGKSLARLCQKMIWSSLEVRGSRELGKSRQEKIATNLLFGWADDGDGVVLTEGGRGGEGGR